jgi:hypothetical protein
MRCACTAHFSPLRADVGPNKENDYVTSGFVAPRLLASVIFGIMADSHRIGESGLAFVLFAGIPFAIIRTVFADKLLTRHVEPTQES